MSVLEQAKEHPIVTSAVVIGGLVIMYLLFRGGASPSQSNALGYDVQAATDAQNASLQAQTQSTAIAAGLQANSENNAVALHIADLQAALQSQTVDASQTVALAQINAAEQYGALETTLTNQTQQAAISADVNKASIAANAAVTSQQTIANALVAQSAQQAQVAQTAIQAANQCHGLGCIFG